MRKAGDVLIGGFQPAGSDLGVKSFQVVSKIAGFVGG